MRVYYYYQFVYKLVYYNNKDETAMQGQGDCGRTPADSIVAFKPIVATKCRPPV